MSKKVSIFGTKVNAKDVAIIKVFWSPNGETVLLAFTVRGTKHLCGASVHLDFDGDNVAFRTRILLNEIWPWGWILAEVEQWANGRMYVYRDVFGDSFEDEDVDEAMNRHEDIISSLVSDDTSIFKLRLEDASLTAVDFSTEEFAFGIVDDVDVSDTEATMEEVPTEKTV